MVFRGRPSTAQHPTVSAYHLDSDATVAWSDGVFAGDKELLIRISRAITAEMQMLLSPITRDLYTANADTPEGAAAAMLAAHPGRMMLVKSPLPDDTELVLPAGFSCDPESVVW